MNDAFTVQVPTHLWCVVQNRVKKIPSRDETVMTWPLRLVLCWVLRSHDQGSWHMPKHMWWPEYISISFNIIRTQRRSIASKMKHTLTWTAFFPAFEPFAPNESAPAVATSALMVILLVPSIVLSLYGMIIDETVKDESSKISNDRRQRHCYYWCKLLECNVEV